MCNNHLTVQQKLTQHCKSTIIQFKKKKIIEEKGYLPEQDFNADQNASF